MNKFRKTYRELTPEQKEHVEQIKDAAERLEQLIDKTPVYMSGGGEQMRQLEHALANLEQAVMWATKAAT